MRGVMLLLNSNLWNLERLDSKPEIDVLWYWGHSDSR
jgi:hypothetical protein